VPYWIAQVLGAFVAAAILYVEYSTGFFSIEKANHITRGSLASNATNIFFTTPHTALGSTVVPTQTAFFDEVLGTALLLFLILAVVDTLNAPPQSNLAPLIIGFVVFAIGMSFGVVSGYAINPARDFGPRLFAAAAGWGQVAFPGNGVGFSNYFWVPIVAPLIGGPIGAYVYDFTIHGVLRARSAPTPGVEEAGRTVVEERTRSERQPEAYG
jgi:glycerol uptake facilitator protein